MTDHVPHAWHPVEPVAINDGRFLTSTDVVCSRCGTRVAAHHAPLVDRIDGYADCDEQLAISVMES